MARSRPIHSLFVIKDSWVFKKKQGTRITFPMDYDRLTQDARMTIKCIYVGEAIELTRIQKFVRIK